ncbi:hypothetical protein JKP88DRAFT_255771 [Tribonema minus]|uniref:Uncharacterized protein n=1 Tax=Tribonema minus TaxID=303371 RepID=A0A835Z0Q1_9STRA|nr:hypothetical protein JKP88DRAFT_255771 [Tribonema minus]
MMPPDVPAILQPRDARASLCEYRSSLLAPDQALVIDTCLEPVDRFPALVFVRTPVRPSPEFVEKHSYALPLCKAHDNSQELITTDGTMLDPGRETGTARNLKFVMLHRVDNNGHSRRDHARNAGGEDNCGSEDADRALEADSTVPEALDGSSGGSGAMHICLDQGTDGRSIDGLTGSNSSGVSGGAGYQCESSGGPAAVAAGVAAAAAAAATAAVAAADACFMEAPGAPLLISAKAASQQDDGAALGGTGQIEACTGGRDSAASFSIAPLESRASPGGSSAACDAGATNVSTARHGRRGYRRAPRASVAAVPTAAVDTHVKTPGKVSCDAPPEDERDRKIWTAGYVAAVNNARHERQQRGSGSAGRPRHSSTASASDEDVAQQFTAAVREAQAQLLRADTRLMELQMRAPQNHHQRASNAVCVLRQQLIKMLADVTKMSKRCSALVSIVRAGPDETPAATATPHTAENGSAVTAPSSQAQEHHAAQEHQESMHAGEAEQVAPAPPDACVSSQHGSAAEEVSPQASSDAAGAGTADTGSAIISMPLFRKRPAGAHKRCGGRNGDNVSDDRRAAAQHNAGAAAAPVAELHDAAFGAAAGSKVDAVATAVRAAQAQVAPYQHMNIQVADVADDSCKGGKDCDGDCHSCTPEPP